MQRLKTIMMVVAVLVVLVSIGSFLGRGTGRGSFRVFAQTGGTLPPVKLFDHPSLELGATQFVSFNVLNTLDVPVDGTLFVRNEDGTTQAGPISVSIAPLNNFRFDYKPPPITGTFDGHTGVVGAPFYMELNIPALTFLEPPITAGPPEFVEIFCNGLHRSIEVRDSLGNFTFASEADFRACVEATKNQLFKESLERK